MYSVVIFFDAYSYSFEPVVEARELACSCAKTVHLQRRVELGERPCGVWSDRLNCLFAVRSQRLFCRVPM